MWHLAVILTLLLCCFFRFEGADDHPLHWSTPPWEAAKRSQVTKMGAARQSAQATLNYFRPVSFWVTKLKKTDMDGLAACLNQQQCN